MAPSSFPTPAAALIYVGSSISTLDSRDSCALNCLGGTSPGSCTALDATCLCANPVWGVAVLTCIQAQCSTQTSLDLAYTKLELYCSMVAVPFTMTEPSFTNTIAAASVASVAATATGSAAVATTTFATAAVVGRAVNVSAIMASICSLLLAISFIIGFFSIKARVIRLRDDQTRSRNQTWGGATAMSNLSTAPSGDTQSKPHGARMLVNPKQKGPMDQLTGPMVGGTTTMGSSMDGGGTDYADAEREAREERIDAARLKRAEAAASMRQENINSLFISSLSPTNLHSSSAPDYRSTTSLVSPSTTSSSYKKDQTHSLGSEDEGQYVTMPARDDNVTGPLTSSTVEDGERVWQVETRHELNGLGGAGGRSRLELDDEEEEEK